MSVRRLCPRYKEEENQKLCDITPLTLSVTHDLLYVCLLEPCSLPFAVESLTPAGCRGWMFGYVEVWALFSVFSLWESLRGHNKVQKVLSPH